MVVRRQWPKSVSWWCFGQHTQILLFDPQGLPLPCLPLKCLSSPVAQWLKLHGPNAVHPGSIPDQGTRSHMPQLKILHARPGMQTWHSQKKVAPAFFQDSFVPQV